MKLLTTILKSSAFGALIGGIVGVGKVFMPNVKENNMRLFPEYSTLSFSPGYCKKLEQIQRFKMYSEEDFKGVLKYTDKFLGIPVLISIKKKFSLVHTAQRYVNKIESHLRGIRSAIKTDSIRAEFNELSADLVKTLNGMCVNMTRDLKSSI